MKSFFKYMAMVAMVGTLGAVTSCNKYLDTEPVSLVTPEQYFSTDAQLRAALMPIYNNVFADSEAQTYNGDAGTDNVLFPDATSKFIENYAVGDESFWNFDDIYDVNYFFYYVLPKLEAGTIKGSKSAINQCVGEAYFLRAFMYYQRYVELGDFPIIKETMGLDFEKLTEASQRHPRNEVARFILEDLDKAIELMDVKAADGVKNLASKYTAYLLKARVALFEASWLTNFKGTAFVPGDAEWPGAAKDYNKDFAYEGGNIDTEIKFFLDAALSASEIVADNVALVENNRKTPQDLETLNPYFEMFGDTDMSGYDEILLWKCFNRDVDKYTHQNNGMISKSNSGCGLSRELVMSFVDKDGYPWYASSLFTNDDDLIKARLGDKFEMKLIDGAEAADPADYAEGLPDFGANDADTYGAKYGDPDPVGLSSDRDPRITLFLKTPYQKNILVNIESANKGLKVEAAGPLVVASEGDQAVTGYLTRKGLNKDGANSDGNGSAENGYIFFRAVEAHLIYMEAYCMVNNDIAGKAMDYWIAIRERAGFADPAASIANTLATIDVTKEAENDWGAYSANQLVSKQMMAIRKERRSEFISEGMRNDDLRRWRAMDQLMSGGAYYHFQPKGMKLWSGDNMKLYSRIDFANNKLSDTNFWVDIMKFVNSQVSEQGADTDFPDYMIPYKANPKYSGYNGVSWKLGHYLTPIEPGPITLTSKEGDLNTSPIYQNPYWTMVAGDKATK